MRLQLAMKSDFYRDGLRELTLIEIVFSRAYVVKSWHLFSF